MEGLLERSLSVRRPFSEKDRGFRDALLWEAAAELVTRGNEVMLISNDRRAFEGDDADGLHPELGQELRAAGAHEDSLVLVRSPGAAINRATAGCSQAQEADPALQRDGYLLGETMCELAKDAAGGEIEQPELLRQGQEDSVLGARLEAAHTPLSLSSNAAVPRASGQITVEVGCYFGADLEGRGEDIYADFEPLVGDGDLEDIGVGLLDNHVHLRVKNRTVRLLGEVSLTRLPNGLTLEAVRLTDVQLPAGSEMPVAA